MNVKSIASTTIAIALLSIYTPCLGASWVEIGQGFAVDSESIDYSPGAVSMFVKYYFSKDESADTKKNFNLARVPQYGVAKETIYCGDRTVHTSAYVVYSKDGNPLKTFTYGPFQIQSIFPDSRYEVLYKTYCKK